MSKPTLTEDELERPSACPREGLVKPFDAGWEAHATGLSREAVRLLSRDPEWALLGWETREFVARQMKEKS